MAVLIDIDQPQESVAPDMPFSVWCRSWAPRHPAAVGVIVALALTVVVAIVGLATAVVIGAKQNTPHQAQVVASTTHTISASVSEGVVSEAVLYRDHTGDMVVRGQDANDLVTGDPASFTNVVGVSVTVRGKSPSCGILVDGVMVDQASGADADQVTCLWMAAAA